MTQATGAPDTEGQGAPPGRRGDAIGSDTLGPGSSQGGQGARPGATGERGVRGGGGSPRRGGAPLPLRPRGGFGGYLHELRRERGLTVRQLAATAGVHHTYVSKLERGDRQAPEEPVVEALAEAVGATPAQLDQLRWRAGLSPRGSGAPGHDDATLTLVAEALGDESLPPAVRDRLRQVIAQVVQVPGGSGQGAAGGRPGIGSPSGAVPQAQAAVPPGAGIAGVAGVGLPGVGAPGFGAAVSGGPGGSVPSFAQPQGLPQGAAPQGTMAPEPVPDGRAALLSGLLGGWQTLDEAAAELRVTAAYLWELIQGGHLRAWALPGLPAGTPAGVRLRREDVLAMLQPVFPLGRR